MARLFGTDGVRGIANKGLTCELAMKIGAAGATVLTDGSRRPKILLGMDTRISGDMLAAALTAGICSVGGDVLMADVLPTPALAYLVRKYEADAAVMISASHNSMEYNGIKWFSNEGFKLSDELEDKIQLLIENGIPGEAPTGGKVGRLVRLKNAQEDYSLFLQSKATQPLKGYRIALDCANGASSGIAAKVFRELGAEVLAFFSEPDGTNINDQCGSTHIERLKKLVPENGADVGFAFDGDADRMIAVDEKGNVMDGDCVMGICALAMKQAGMLKNDTLVLTVMSNLGLKTAMKQNGISVEETQVGDRYVLDRMLQKGFNLGGEQSGHMIFLDHNTTGDGILSAIQLMNVICASGKKAGELASQIPIYPQTLVNVVVDDNKAAMKDETLLTRCGEVEQKLAGKGRVLVRASGTEPLVRIMIEGEDSTALDAYAMELAQVLVEKFGGSIKR